MSKISSIYDAAVTRIAGVLPTYNRLANPYTPLDNPEIFLKRGFGLTIGAGNNNRTLLNKQIPIERSIVVILTREVVAKENDATTKATAEKALLEDQFLVISDFHTNSTLNDTAVDTTYIADSGIQLLSGDKGRFLQVTIDFRITYFEQLS